MSEPIPARVTRCVRCKKAGIRKADDPLDTVCRYCDGQIVVMRFESGRQARRWVTGVRLNTPERRRRQQRLFVESRRGRFKYFRRAGYGLLCGLVLDVRTADHALLPRRHRLDARLHAQQVIDALKTGQPPPLPHYARGDRPELLARVLVAVSEAGQCSREQLGTPAGR